MKKWTIAWGPGAEFGKGPISEQTFANQKLPPPVAGDASFRSSARFLQPSAPFQVTGAKFKTAQGFLNRSSSPYVLLLGEPLAQSTSIRLCQQSMYHW